MFKEPADDGQRRGAGYLVFGGRPAEHYADTLALIAHAAPLVAELNVVPRGYSTPRNLRHPRTLTSPPAASRRIPPNLPPRPSNPAASAAAPRARPRSFHFAQSVPGHLRIDLEDVVTEIRDVRLFAIHPAIVLGNAGPRPLVMARTNRQSGMHKPAKVPPCRFSVKTLLSALLG
jgi:hypothetical protein